jgi:Zn-dependent peptidase ImmA (M78 family)
MNERALAEALLAAHPEFAGPPVLPDLIARADGVHVDVLDEETSLSYSGWYKFEDGRPVILYNAREPLTRQRFTIAHELGHHVLRHGERPRDNASSFSLLAQDPRERAANAFAAELLMPAGAVRARAQSPNARLERLAREFGVSSVAMRFRLKNLGLVS